MFLRTFWLCGALASLLALHGPAHARQTPNNDGFQRRNGQMQVVRNGQARPMTRDAHLPTGATVTKDGFVVSPTGQRTELREGQGCDLRGRPVAVQVAANGALALGASSAPVPVRSIRSVPAPSLLEQVFGSGDDEDEGKFKFKKRKKHHGKGHGRWKGDD
ncbi:hypothetical protein GCM10028824_02220 [Hymenobacter segetis]|uniref:DUF6799 domain-containing protein n=1 Tax=Hymenobacter segetis TaxID=2025509 RepID=A0ABU9LTD6_9BACT